MGKPLNRPFRALGKLARSARESARAESARAESARAESARAESARAESARAESASQASSRSAKAPALESATKSESPLQSQHTQPAREASREPAPAEPSEADTFSDVAAREGVKRAAWDRARVAPPPPPPRLSARAEESVEHAFSVRQDAERIEVRRNDTEEMVWAWLQRQDPQAVLDLHGKTAEVARRALHRFVRGRTARGDTVVLVVTGRGRRSSKEPVLKRGAVEWLVEPAVGDKVRAFVSAPSSRGGAGAIMVLLDPRRPA